MIADPVQDGNTALHIAALRRDQEVVMLLLDRSYIKDYFNIAVTNKVNIISLLMGYFASGMSIYTPHSPWHPSMGRSTHTIVILAIRNSP